MKKTKKNKPIFSTEVADWYINDNAKAMNQLLKTPKFDNINGNYKVYQIYLKKEDEWSYVLVDENAKKVVYECDSIESMDSYLVKINIIGNPI